MNIETNSPETREHRYGVLMVAEYNGEKTGVLGRYKTRVEMMVGYLLWATNLDEMNISENLYVVEFNDKGAKVLEDLLLELHGIVIEEARRRHSLN